MGGVKWKVESGDRKCWVKSGGGKWEVDSRRWKVRGGQREVGSEG